VYEFILHATASSEAVGVPWTYFARGFARFYLGAAGAVDARDAPRLRARLDTHGDGFVDGDAWATFPGEWVRAGAPPMAEYLAGEAPGGPVTPGDSSAGPSRPPPRPPPPPPRPPRPPQEVPGASQPPLPADAPADTNGTNRELGALEELTPPPPFVPFCDELAPPAALAALAEHDNAPYSNPFDRNSLWEQPYAQMPNPFERESLAAPPPNAVPFVPKEATS
jgi:hypothetical protein